MCTGAVEFHAHRLAQGPIALFEGNVSPGNQLANWSVSASPQTPEPPNARPRLHRCRTRRRAWHWSSHGGRASRIRADSWDCRTSCAHTPLPDVWIRSSAGTDEWSPSVPALRSCHCEALRQRVCQQLASPNSRGRVVRSRRLVPKTSSIIIPEPPRFSSSQGWRWCCCREQVHRFQVSGQSHTIIGSTTCPLLHQREFVTCSVLLERKILELHVQFFKRFAQLHHLSTRHWLMRQLSAVHAKSMAFGATTQGPSARQALWRR